MTTAAAILATAFSFAFITMEVCKLRERLFPGTQAAANDPVAALIGLAMEGRRALARRRAR